MNTSDIIKEVTANIEKNANVKAVFGEPYEKGDLTVIPVCRTSVWGGGGGGSNPSLIEANTQENTVHGGGMGVRIKTTPSGYIEIDKEGARFVEITRQSQIVLSGIALGAFAIFSFTRLLKKLFAK